MLGCGDSQALCSCVNDLSAKREVIGGRTVHVDGHTSNYVPRYVLSQRRSLLFLLTEVL